MKIEKKSQREILHEKMITAQQECERLEQLYKSAAAAASEARFNFFSYCDVESARQLSEVQQDEARTRKAEETMRQIKLDELRALGVHV